MKKNILIAMITIFLLVLAFPKASLAVNGADCQARGGWCDKACITKPSIGGYDCPSGWQCCGDASTAQQNALGQGGLNPLGGTGSPTTASGGGSVMNPISANSFGELFQQAMNYFKTIAGAIAVLFIILGGVMYMASGGNTGMAERAKNTLIYAITGLAIVVAAPLFLSDMLLILKGGGSSKSSGLMMVALNVLRLLLACIGVFGIMGLLNGAIIMFISSGDEKTITFGRSSVKYSLMAIALSFGSLILVKTFMEMILG